MFLIAPMPASRMVSSAPLCAPLVNAPLLAPAALFPPPDADPDRRELAPEEPRPRVLARLRLRVLAEALDRPRDLRAVVPLDAVGFAVAPVALEAEPPEEPLPEVDFGRAEERLPALRGLAGFALDGPLPLELREPARVDARCVVAAMALPLSLVVTCRP
jgi:hypothetical protein